MLNIIAPIISPLISKALDLIPNSNDRAEAKEELEKGIMNAVTSANAAQNKINEIEAGHQSIFVAGWRPFIGWVAGIALAWSFVVRPIVITICAASGIDVSVIPTLDSAELFQLVLAMLGMGGLRTFEKMKGVARNTAVTGKK